MTDVIYLIGNDQYCKLGYTQNLTRRLKQLQRWPGEITVFHQIPGNPKMEQRLHQKARSCGPYCGGKAGEWYPIHRKSELIRMMNRENPQITTFLGSIPFIGRWIHSLLPP